VKRAALAAGALGSSLSGSGPSIFALCRDLESADAVSRKMAEAFADAARLEWDLHVSKVSPLGARLTNERQAACAS
jgi:homoserine kinase